MASGVDGWGFSPTTVSYQSIISLSRLRGRYGKSAKPSTSPKARHAAPMDATSNRTASGPTAKPHSHRAALRKNFKKQILRYVCHTAARQQEVSQSFRLTEPRSLDVASPFGSAGSVRFLALSALSKGRS
jgi:hypothetical protein